jgi:LysM repeat protein
MRFAIQFRVTFATLALVSACSETQNSPAPETATSPPYSVQIVSTVEGKPAKTPQLLDSFRGVPSRGIITTTHTVQRGDTLSGIASAFNTTVVELQAINKLNRENVIIGETLLVRLPVEGNAPSIKLIPDSELVFSPSAVGFNIASFVASQPGYLARYTQEIDDETISGAEIVQRISEQQSIHPRILLAALEYASGWLSNPAPTGDASLFPLGNRKTNQNGLYFQLAWAGARLNEGYYGWRLNNRYVVKFSDETYGFVGDGINAGTAGLQNFIAAIGTRATWQSAMSDNAPDAFIQTYRKYFGDAWRHDLGLLVPDDLRQPPLALPFSKGEMWFMTGGPHSSYGRGTPWGAIDFTSQKVFGCRELSEWVTAMADGVIARSARGEVVQTLNGNDERVGWSVLYLHIGSTDRVAVGERIKRGERIGHPSCEGGVSSGAHVHIARKYNGEWINGHGRVPFMLGDWAMYEGKAEYDGGLKRGNQTREACECKKPEVNGISW